MMPSATPTHPSQAYATCKSSIPSASGTPPRSRHGAVPAHVAAFVEIAYVTHVIQNTWVPAGKTVDCPRLVPKVSVSPTILATVVEETPPMEIDAPLANPDELIAATAPGWSVTLSAPPET